MTTPLANPLFSPLALSSARNRQIYSKIRFDSKHGKTFESNAIQKLNLSRFRKPAGLRSQKFLQMGSQEMSFERKLSIQAMDGAGIGNTSTISRNVSLKMLFDSPFSSSPIQKDLNFCCCCYTPGVCDNALVGLAWDHTCGRHFLEAGVCSSVYQVPKCSVWDVLYLLCSYGIGFGCSRCCNKSDEFLRACASVYPEMASFVLRSFSCCSPSFRQRYSGCFRRQNLLHCRYIISCSLVAFMVTFMVIFC